MGSLGKQETVPGLNSPSGPVHRALLGRPSPALPGCVIGLSHESARRKNQCYLAPDISIVLIGAVLALCSDVDKQGISVWGFPELRPKRR